MAQDGTEAEGRNTVDAPSKAAGRVRLLTLSHLDGRTAAAQRARALVAGLESDLGGADVVTVAERQLVQRAAILGALIEDAETRWLAGQAIDLNGHLASINAQRRVLATLGLERRSREITPTLAEYLGTKGSAA